MRVGRLAAALLVAAASLSCGVTAPAEPGRVEAGAADDVGDFPITAGTTGHIVATGPVWTLGVVGDEPARFLVVWRERYPDYDAEYRWAVHCDPPRADCGVPWASRLRASYAPDLDGVRVLVEGLAPDDLVAVYDLQTASEVPVRAQVEQVERVETHTEEVVTWSVGE